MDVALWPLLLLIVATGAFGVFVFFGGTVALLFSRVTPWSVRKRWAILSLTGAFVGLAAGGALWIFKIDSASGFAILLTMFAVLAPPICNWAVYNRYRKSVSTPAPSVSHIAPEVTKRPLALWACLAISLVLIVLPALVAGPGFAVFVAFWALCALALSFGVKFASIRRQRLRNLSVYLLSAVLAVIVHANRVDTAQARGEALVSAVKKFRTDNQRYPSSLEELIPKYADSVPVAAYGRYYYSNSVDGGPLFFYVTFPPFGRRGYCFEATRSCALNFDNPSARNVWFDFD